jgi:hypothetical protein
MSSTITPSPHTQDEFIRQIRERFLGLPPSTWGMEPTPECPEVYGVLMEWPYDGVTLTLAVFCDGSASLYGSHGNGIIGGDADAHARSEARALVRAAGTFYPYAAPASEFPYPGPGHVRFYLLTFQGVRVLEAPLASLDDGPEQYTGLYFRGMAVFERLLICTGEHPDHDEAAPAPRCGRSGAEGYVHCLLTCMSWGLSACLTVTATGPVPDLAALAAENDYLREWLATHAFPYGSLHGRSVIRALRGAAGIKGLPLFTRRGEYCILYETDAGEAVPCVFDIVVAPFDRSATVTLAPHHDPRVTALRRSHEQARNGAASR